MNVVLKKPLVIVTGSGGLIGRRIQNALKANYQVIGLDLHQPKTADDDCIWMRCDLTDENDINETLQKIQNQYGNQVASVIHLAAYYDFAGRDSPLYEKLTVAGSERLMKALQVFHVEQFVFSSTNLVMKPASHLEDILTEDDTLEGKWAYPESKIAAEKILKESHASIPLVILRIAGAYDEEGHSPPICNQIQRIYESKIESIFYPGDKRKGQAFIHLDDLIAFITRVVEQRNSLSLEEVFFVAEPKFASYENMQKRIGQLIHGRSWPTIRIPKFVAKIGAWAKDLSLFGQAFIKPWMVDLTDDHYPLSMKRAKEKLGFEPKHSIFDTLPAIVKNLKENPKKFYKENKLRLPERLLGRPTYEEKVDMEAIPKRWKHNPSSFDQRIPVCILAGIAFVIAIYMSLYQLGLIANVWDPVFGDQSEKVLKSDVSHEMSNWIRMPDALLGALAYLGDILFALAGSTRRWQFRPWLVILFGLDVIPLGIVSVILVFMQGLVVGSWCFLCLVTAGISLALIALAYDEVWSSVEFLIKVWKKTKSPSILWKTFIGVASKEAHEVAESMIRKP